MRKSGYFHGAGWGRMAAVILAMGSLTLASCGYTTRSMLNSHYRTVYVAPFANKVDITNEGDSSQKYKVYRPMLENDVTRTVSHRFLMDGNLKPVGQEYADLILKGELVEFRRDPLRYKSNDEVDEYRLNVVVNISLWERNADKPLWEEKNFTGNTTYFVNGAAAESEDTAINDAAGSFPQDSGAHCRAMVTGNTRIYLFAGEDIQAKTVQLNKLKEEFLPADIRDFNFDVLYSRELALQDLQERLLSIPVNSPEKNGGDKECGSIADAAVKNSLCDYAAGVINRCLVSWIFPAGIRRTISSPIYAG